MNISFPPFNAVVIVSTTQRVDEILMVAEHVLHQMGAFFGANNNLLTFFSLNDVA
jgi:hypothetical protein